jgi:hypothetical protein
MAILTGNCPFLPVFWEDNYISLLPKEKRVVMVEFDKESLDEKKPLLKVDGWNVRTKEKEMYFFLTSG